jgi:hypothetical protein
MLEPISESLEEFRIAIVGALSPLLSKHGFAWIGPIRERMLYQTSGGEFFREIAGGWQSIDLVLRTYGTYEVQFYLSVSARIDEFDKLWMTKVLERPDEIDKTLATVRIHLGTYLYQWNLPTTENYPAPLRTPQRAEKNDISFYANRADEARGIIRNYVIEPLECTLLPLVLRCESAADLHEVGKINPYFSLQNKAQKLTLAYLAQDQEAIRLLVDENCNKGIKVFDKAVSSLK